MSWKALLIALRKALPEGMAGQSLAESCLSTSPDRREMAGSLNPSALASCERESGEKEKGQG